MLRMCGILGIQAQTRYKPLLISDFAVPIKVVDYVAYIDRVKC